MDLIHFNLNRNLSTELIANISKFYWLAVSIIFMHAYYINLKCFDIKYLLLCKFLQFIRNWDDISLFVYVFLRGIFLNYLEIKIKKIVNFCSIGSEPIELITNLGTIFRKSDKKAELFHRFTTWGRNSSIMHLINYRKLIS